MVSSHQEGRVIWTRQIDWGEQRSRRQKLLRFYVFPAIAAMLITLLVGGVGAMLGVLIVLGLVGLMLVAWVEGTNFNKRANRELRVVGHEIVMGKQRINIPNVERFTTYMTSIQGGTVAGGTTISTSVHAGAAEFLVRLDTPRRGLLGETLADHVKLIWPRMTEHELSPLAMAIEWELPVNWIPLEQFRAKYSRD